jgi:hypothetical protein
MGSLGPGLGGFNNSLSAKAKTSREDRWALD